MAKLRQYKRRDYGIEMVDYTWQEVHDNQEQMKKEFRDKNQTDAVMASGRRDRSYDDYCKELENFLDSVSLEEIPLEYRIEEAKKRREKGNTPWKCKEGCDEIHFREMNWDFTKPNS